MAVVWDVGTAIVAEGSIAPGSALVRVHLTTIPGYLGQSAETPPRYWRLGVVGPIRGTARASGTRLLYADQEVTSELPHPTGWYWSLVAGVAGTLYRGIETMTELGIGARVYRTTGLTLATATGIAIEFDGERFDPFGLHSSDVNPSRLTAPEPGWYLVGGAVRWESGPAGLRALSLRVNGATSVGKTSGPTTSETGFTWQTINTVYYLSTGDYVEILAEQQSGGDLDVEVNPANSPEAWLVKLA